MVRIEQRNGLSERGDRLAARNEFVADPLVVAKVAEQAGDGAPVDLLPVIPVAPARRAGRMDMADEVEVRLDVGQPNIE